MDEQIYQILILDVLRKIWFLSCHGQTEPDGKNCAICSDNDHQAFECRFNAFKMSGKEVKLCQSQSKS